MFHGDVRNGVAPVADGVKTAVSGKELPNHQMLVAHTTPNQHVHDLSKTLGRPFEVGLALFQMGTW